MACSVDLPPLDSCNNNRKITFQVLRGIVSNVLYFDNALSFEFGTHRQIITVYNYSGDQWLQNGMNVEVDFDNKIIDQILDE